MDSTAIRESEKPENGAAPANGNGNGNGNEQAASRNNITALKELTLRLVREVQSIGEVHKLSLEGGLDFYDEVTRFEIDLIKRALLQTAGHQGRAARLLNLKVTTLNSKIKHYNISLKGFADGYPLVETTEAATAQPA